MALTSKDASKVKENVHTDIRQGENVQLPSGRKLSPEAQILFNKSIVAKRMGVPTSEEIHIKNTEYRYRWANFSGMNGVVYRKWKAMGGQDATLEDVKPLTQLIDTASGQIRLGDLILMKFDRNDYDSHIKQNMERAMALQNRKNFGMYIQGEREDAAPSTDPMSDERVSRRSVSTEPFNRKGVAMFVPSEEELNLKLGGDPNQSTRRE